VKKIIATLSFAALFAGSCSRSQESTVVETTEEVTVKQAAEIEYILYDIAVVSEDMIDSRVDGTIGGRTESCATIQNNTVTRVLTADFGQGCSFSPSLLRKGKMIINYELDNSKRRITFDNYSVNGYKIEGSVGVSEIIRIGTDRSATYLANNLIVTRPNGSQFTISMFQRNTSIKEKDRGLADNEIISNGYFSSTNSANEKFSIFTDNITVRGNCVESGVLTPSVGLYRIQLPSKDETQLRFGRGACSKEATLIIGNTSRIITFP
jgi:hypothetical protein